MKTIGELRKAIAELPDNAPLGVEIQTNGGDDLEFTSVDGVDVLKEWVCNHGRVRWDTDLVNLIVTSNSKQ